MSKKPRTYPKAGRPRVDTPKVKKSVSLLPDVHQYLLQVGWGNLSSGVETAAEFHKASLQTTAQNAKRIVMKSRQLFVFCAVALAASLTACGGGGGGSTTPVTMPIVTPAVSTATPAVATSPVTGYTLANLPLSTYGLSSSENAMFTVLNRTRIGGGFGALEQSAFIDKAAKSHAEYIIANYFTNSGGLMTKELSIVLSDGSLTAHTEVAGTKGFTGNRTADRLAAAGYLSQDSSEVVAFSIGSKPGDEPIVTDCLSQLTNSVFHRSVLINPLYVDVGIGVSDSVVDSKGYKYKSCVLDFARTGSAPSFADNFMGIYPFDGQTSVPLIMALEVPDPAAEFTIKGSPVSFQGVYPRPLSVITFELRDANAVLVQTKLVTRAQSNYLLPSEAYLVPDGALKPNSTYSVGFSGSSNGVALNKSWSFTTAAN